MKLRAYFLFALVCLVGITGCKDDDDDNNVKGGPTGPGCANAWATDLQDELNVISVAATNFANDPSTANCNAFKAAYQDYLDALKPYGNCAALSGTQRANWQQAVEQAEDNVDSIC